MPLTKALLVSTQTTHFMLLITFTQVRKDVIYYIIMMNMCSQMLITTITEIHTPYFSPVPILKCTP